MAIREVKAVRTVRMIPAATEARENKAGKEETKVRRFASYSR